MSSYVPPAIFKRSQLNQDETTRCSKRITNTENADREEKTLRLRQERLLHHQNRSLQPLLQNAESDLLEFAFNSMGDRWFLCWDNLGDAHIVHRANSASGGDETKLPAQQFLDDNPSGVEQHALRAILKFWSARE